jgi:5-methyltetrahydropteroyltriglutamate--homocysteine methyltransferase
MKRSEHRILTTHAGSLTRPADLIDLYSRDAPDAELLPRLGTAIRDIIRQQTDAGIDVVNEGEFGKPTLAKVEYAAWGNYIFERMSGFTIKEEVTGVGPHSSRDRATFGEFYNSGEIPGGGGGVARSYQMVCAGSIKYTGQAVIERDIANFKAGLKGVNVEDAFMSAVSPATITIRKNEFYANDEEYSHAVAQALNDEYRAIVDGGFVLQIDDPCIVDLYDWWFSLGHSWEEYMKWAEFQVEVMNHALKGIPEDRIRYHFCWGSWHGPHSSDVELAKVVGLLLKIKAQGYSVEAGNVRHAHEWKVWRDVAKLPDGKLLIPGVVSHATNVVEHPELIADRLIQYATAVGRENVIAGTDCGLGGRVHPQLAWAKLRALSEGAALASKQLWR